LWAVPVGVIGGRIYHVITDWELFSDHPERIVQIWKGGLGIWGGIFLGVVVGIWVGHRRGIATSVLLTCVAPALPLAQSIGRWGNWFNQELFGRPTTLPWALEVSDFRTKQAGYPVGTLFHPTFLYESLACLVLCGLLLLLDKHVTRPGYLFLYYTAGYTLFRFFIEGLRIDPAHSAGGLRLNQWVSLVVFTVSVSMVALARRNKSDLPA
jgi:prolipoprotein diacylglyceryl transferase